MLEELIIPDYHRSRPIDSDCNTSGDTIQLKPASSAICSALIACCQLTKTPDKRHRDLVSDFPKLSTPSACRAAHVSPHRRAVFGNGQRAHGLPSLPLGRPMLALY